MHGHGPSKIDVCWQLCLLVLSSSADSSSRMTHTTCVDNLDDGEHLLFPMLHYSSTMQARGLQQQ